MDLKILTRIEIENLLRPLFLNLTEVDENKLIKAMIEYTQRNRYQSYSQGYDQGKFDKTMEVVYENKENY